MVIKFSFLNCGKFGVHFFPFVKALRKKKTDLPFDATTERHCPFQTETFWIKLCCTCMYSYNSIKNCTVPEYIIP